MAEKENKKSYTKVIDYIKIQIKSGQLKLGDKLPSERELSETIGVSRNSVREAIRTLDFMGVISSQHGAGNYLSGSFENNLVQSLYMLFLLNEIDYKQISELRFCLEMQSLMLAIDNIEELEVEKLKNIIEKLDKGDLEESNVSLDKELHYTIAKASNNILIIDILQALTEVMDRFIVDLRREIFMVDKGKERLMAAHKDIVKSIITKDKELGRQAINKHFEVVDENIKYN